MIISKVSTINNSYYLITNEKGANIEEHIPLVKKDLYYPIDAKVPYLHPDWDYTKYPQVYLPYKFN